MGGSRESPEDHHRCGDDLHHDFGGVGVGRQRQFSSFWRELNRLLVQAAPPESHLGGVLGVRCEKESHGISLADTSNQVLVLQGDQMLPDMSKRAQHRHGSAGRGELGW